MFANPLGLLALLAVPAVLALHLYRRRHDPRRVSALFLWEGARQDPAAGPTRDRLERTVSLILECLAALLLALALAGPRGCEEGGRHLVVVLDSTASMGAETGEGTAEERARALLEERISSLRGRDRVTVTRQDGSVIAGPQALPGEALTALERWSPSSAGGDLGLALSLATALAGGEQVWLITDTPPSPDDPWPANTRLDAVGGPADNIGFVDAGRVSGPSELFATVASFSATPWSGSVQLLIDERAGPTTPIQLEPGGRTALRLPLPEGAGTARLTLLSASGEPLRDALGADDSVVLVPPATRELVLGSALPAAMNRALGLDGGPLDPTGVARWAASVPQARAASTGEANLALSRTPLGRSGVWTVLITGSASPDTPSKEAALAGPLLRTQHPLLEGFSGAGLLWTPASLSVLTPEDTPVLLAGSRPLIVAHAGDDPRFTVDLDPWRSTISRSSDWPVLLLNLAELRREALPGLDEANLRVGEPLRWRGDGELALEVTGPSAATLRGQGLVEQALAGIGLFEVRADGGQPVSVAVNLLNAAESDLRARGEEERESTSALAAASLGGGGAEVILTLLALVLAAADQAVLARRRR